MKKFFLALLAAVTAAALFCGAAPSVATYNAGYQAPAGIDTIVVQDNSAAVVVQAADTDHISVDYTYSSSYAPQGAALYDFSVAGSTLTVTKTREPTSSITIQSKDTRTCTLTLQVPRQALAGLTVSTTNEDVSLRGVSAQTATLSTDNGRIEVADFSGGVLSGTTRNGKISMSGVAAQSLAATIQNSGTLKLERVAADSCTASVQNGSITGSVVGSNADYSLNLTASGKIYVSDSNDKSFVLIGKDSVQQNIGTPKTLALSTRNGDVNVEFVK